MMNQFQYKFPPSIKHMPSINNNSANQPKTEEKRVKMVNILSQRPELKLIANKYWDSVWKVKQNTGYHYQCGVKAVLKYHSKRVFYLDWKLLGYHQDLKDNDTK